MSVGGGGEGQSIPKSNMTPLIDVMFADLFSIYASQPDARRKDRQSAPAPPISCAAAAEVID